MSTSFHSLLDQAVAAGIASSISLYLGSKSQERSIFVGRADQNTIYDIASLTKIIGTTLAMAKAVSEGHISLTEQPFDAWPGLGVRDLLAHSSGLAAHVKFYEKPGISRTNFAHNQKLIFSALFDQRPQAKPGTVRLYSDLNFLALGWLLEQRLSKPLWEIFLNTWASLNIPPDFGYFPSSCTQASEHTHVAPTGFCQKRETRVRAQVNDLNCYFLGGLAGHAGLFAQLASVAALGDFLLRLAKQPRDGCEALIADFARKGLGFDKPTPTGSVRALSASSFGHFGFTGTSLWIDPQGFDGQGLVVALLTNRVDKSLRPEGIFWLRRRIHELASRMKTFE